MPSNNSIVKYVESRPLIALWHGIFLEITAYRTIFTSWLMIENKIFYALRRFSWRRGILGNSFSDIHCNTSQNIINFLVQRCHSYVLMSYLYDLHTHMHSQDVSFTFIGAIIQNITL